MVRLVGLFCLLTVVAAEVFFYVMEGGQKCFVENIPEKFFLSIDYNNPENPGSTCAVKVFERNKSQFHEVASQRITSESPKGKLTHVTSASGEHKICIACEKQGWFNPQQVKFSLKYEASDYKNQNLSNVAQKTQMSQMEQSLTKLVERVESIAAENEYEKKQERAFQKATETISSRVRSSSILQLITVVLCAAFSVVYLLRFFHNQRIF